MEDLLAKDHRPPQAVTPMDTPDEALGTDLPEDLQARIKQELEPGERLIWSGQAVASRYKAGSGAPAVILFAVGLLVVSAFFWAAFYGKFGPHEKKAEEFFLVVGLLATSAGALTLLGMLGGAISRRMGKNIKPLYALTDRRAILWKPRQGTAAIEVVSVPRGKFKRVHRLEYPDGTGDVLFGHADGQYFNPFGFESVADVRRVEALVRTVLLGPAGSEAEAAGGGPLDDRAE